MKERLGDYRIVREISRGGMGVVYLAEQVSLRRRVALKVLHSGSGFSKRHLDRFRREAEALARLHHPNIVPVFGIGEEAGVHYFSMEYIEGRTLDTVIDDLKRTAEAQAKDGRRAIADPYRALTEKLRPGAAPAAAAPPSEPAPETAGPPSEKEPSPASDAPTDRSYVETVVRIVRDVARALHYAHEQGIVHRDVKPHNVILDQSGKPFVMDFGLARDEMLATLTQSGDVFGTPLYMSPEQVSGRRSEIGPRTDVYSLGCTLYELLTLTPAFDAETSEEILRKILLAEPRRPRQLNRRLPPDLENVTLRAMQKDASRRYASAAEFADDLDRFLNYEAVRAAPPSALETTLRKIRRYRAVSAALGVALLSSLLFVYLFFVRSGTIVVDTGPVPASVFLGGTLIGHSGGGGPLVVGARPGEYELLVMAEGDAADLYRAERKRVEIRAGAPTMVQIGLRKSTGTLQVEKRPPDAVVRIVGDDGSREEISEVGTSVKRDLREGRYTVEVEAPRHKPFTKPNVTIRSEESELLVADLDRDLRSVRIVSTVAIDADKPSPDADKEAPREDGAPWLLSPGKWTFRTVEDNVVPETIEIDADRREATNRWLRPSALRKSGPYNVGDGRPLSGAPALDDLDRDGIVDIVAASSEGEVVVINRVGPDRKRRRVASLRAPIVGSPVLASLPADPTRFAFLVSRDARVFAVAVAVDGAIPDTAEVVAESLDAPVTDLEPLGAPIVHGSDDRVTLAVPMRNGPLVVADFDGQSFAERPGAAGPILAAAPSARDVDGDGVLDFLLETASGVGLYSGFDGSLLVSLEEGPVAPGSRPATLLFDDLTGDGRPEALVARDRRIACHACDGGQPLWTSADVPVEGLAVVPARPVGLDVLAFTAANARVFSGTDGLERRERILSHNRRRGEFLGACVLDLDGNGTEDVILGLDSGVVVLAADRTWVYAPPAADGPPLTTAPVVADVDGDGALEIVVGLRGGEVVVLRGSVPRRLFRFDLPGPGPDLELDPEFTVAEMDNEPPGDVVLVARSPHANASDAVFIVDGRDGAFHTFASPSGARALAVPLDWPGPLELMVLSSEKGKPTSIHFPRLGRRGQPFSQGLYWNPGRTFLADFNEDGRADLVRVDRVGLIAYSGADGSLVARVLPSRLGEGSDDPRRVFPGSHSDPIAALFQDLDQDRVFDVLLGFPSGEDDAAGAPRVIAIGWPEGRGREARRLWEASVPKGLSPRLHREDDPGAPVVVTWHDGAGESAPLRGVEIRDSATGSLLSAPVRAGDFFAQDGDDSERSGRGEPELLAVLGRAEAGRALLLVRVSPERVAGFALAEKKLSRAYTIADKYVSWLAAGGRPIRAVRDPDPIGLVYLSSGPRLLAVDAATGRVDSRHVLPEPADGLALRHDPSGALVAVYVSGGDLLTACAVPAPFEPRVWGPGQHSTRDAAQIGELVETIARVAELKRGGRGERAEAEALAERVLATYLGRDDRARAAFHRPEPAVADLLRVLATVAR